MEYVKIKYYDKFRREERTTFAIKTRGDKGPFLYRRVDEKGKPTHGTPKTLLVPDTKQLIWEHKAEMHKDGYLVTPYSKKWKTRKAKVKKKEDKSKAKKLLDVFTKPLRIDS